MRWKIGTRPGAVMWLNSEPCGLICGCMTWLLLFYGMYATSIGVIIPWLGFSFYGLLHLFLFNGVSLVGLYSHIKVMTTDPGAVPPRAFPLADDEPENEYAANRAIAVDPSVPFKKYCRRCKAYKPQRAHHCSICGRCIVKMDHHCPWVNNCVGVGNHKLFLLFVFWVFVSCMYSMLLVLVKYIYCIGGHHKCHTSPRLQFLVIFLVVESILFGLFTLCMLGDQMSAISSNQTAIDRLKGTRHNYQMEVNEVCGSGRAVRCHYSWFLPRAVTFPDGVIREKIMGYRLLGGGGSGKGAGGDEEGEEGEEFNPLLDGGGGDGGGAGNGAPGEDRGDVEMGTLHGHGHGVGTGGVMSSPGGGYVLRKKMAPRNGGVDAREDENNSQNTNTSNESYGLEEPLSDWLDSSSGPSTATTAAAAGAMTGNGSGGGIAEVGGVSGHGSPTAAGHNGGPSGSLSSSRLAEIAIGNADGTDESTAVRRVTSGGVGGSNPTSPAVLLTSKDGGVTAGNHNATRRKRSGVPGAN